MPIRTISEGAPLDQFVDEILSVLPQRERAEVLALSGDLGAGKTTFTQALAQKLGVVEHVVSPTFMIMKRYKTKHERFDELIHIDAYRVEDEAELTVLRIEELFKRPGTIVSIEWPERIPCIVPDDALKIHFAIETNETRTVTYGN